MTDDLAATLAGIRERAGVFVKLGPPRPVASAVANAAYASAADVPPLLAALEAVLERHVEAVIEDMPGPFHYCKTCSGHPKWPCPEVRDISAALAGEGAGDG